MASLEGSNESIWRVIVTIAKSREGRRGRSQKKTAQLSEMILSISLKEVPMWNIDLLLGNDNNVSKYIRPLLSGGL
jgi:hypothetical protein